MGQAPKKWKAKAYEAEAASRKLRFEIEELSCVKCVMDTVNQVGDGEICPVDLLRTS